MKKTTVSASAKDSNWAITLSANVSFAAGQMTPDEKLRVLRWIRVRFMKLLTKIPYGDVMICDVR